MAEVNRRIYEERYDPQLLERRSTTPYDAAMIELRDELLRAYAVDRDVLDLCCGIGEYAVPIASLARRTLGLDFSGTMLRSLRGRSEAAGVLVLQADAGAIPLCSECLDIVVSFASLYHIPDIDAVVSEVARVLRPGGVAILEFGNLWSLNTVVARSQHKRKGWAESHHVPYSALRRKLRAAELNIEEWRSFQVLPMFGAPRALVWLLPLLSARWKRVMGIQVRGRMLDERISSSRLLRRLAFRHLVVVKKPCG